jgi:ABC-type multidrug transport system fused ATPase/permease subunit
MAAPNGRTRPDLPRLVTGRRRWLLALLVANGVGQAATATATVLLVEATFERLLAGGPRGSVGGLLPYAGGLVLTALAVGYLRARERADAERLGQSYVHDLRTTMYARLAALSPRALQRRSQGSVMLRFVGDLRAVGQWVSLGLSRLLVGGVFAVGSLAALAVVAPPLAAAVGLVLALGLAAALGSGGTMRDRTRQARRHRARLAANLGDKVGAIGVVQLSGRMGKERRKLHRQSDELSSAMVARAQLVGRLRGITEVTAGLATIAVLLAGSWAMRSGQANAGTVVAAMAIVGLMTSPLRDLGRVHELWHNSRVSLEKVESFLRTPTLVHTAPDAVELEPGPGELAFEDVRLEGSLRGVSAVAEPGSLVAVVGPNGSGKSTLMSLVGRLIDPDRGRVLIDGQDLRRVKPSSARRAVSMAGPDFPLMRGSVRKNLRYRDPDAPDEEVEEISRLCGLDDLIAELPEGLETKVVEGGRNLSAGQRQRIALARSLLRDPLILLLDEADANLDDQARELLERIMADRRGRRTTVVVTHRSDLLERVDAIWRLEDGRLAEVTGPLEPVAAGGPPPW